MNKITDFYKGQKVQFKDGDTGKMVKGRVKRVEQHDIDVPNSINRVSIEWDDLMDPVWHYADEFNQIIIVSRRRKVLATLLLLALFLIVSCSPTHKMVMPDGCKAKKQTTYKMVNPEPTIERKK